MCNIVGNIHEQLFCTSCGHHYHGNCLHPPVEVNPIVRAGWQCPDCKICQMCRYDLLMPKIWEKSDNWKCFHWEIESWMHMVDWPMTCWKWQFVVCLIFWQHVFQLEMMFELVFCHKVNLIMLLMWIYMNRYNSKLFAKGNTRHMSLLLSFGKFLTLFCQGFVKWEKSRLCIQVLMC